jgi:hypothetical protein
VRQTFEGGAEGLEIELSLVILRAPLAVCKVATVSFVQVSPSTVIALNVPVTALRNARESSDDEIAASVWKPAWCHVGLNHSRSLAAPENPNSFSADAAIRRRPLGASIGGHNRPRELREGYGFAASHAD